MAKKKKEYDADSARALLDAGWASWHAGMDPAEAAVSSVGLYLPHLCLRYLFQGTIMPFERTILVFGLTGSNKSSFLYWLYDLFRLAGGKYAHYEVEVKDTPLFRLSLTGFDRAAGRVIPCESMDHFQREVKLGFEKIMEICSSGLGKRVPFIAGIDSLTAKMTEDAYKTVDKNDGAMSRRWGDEARSLSDWYKVAPGYLVGWPFTLVGIRHDKPTKDQYGHDKHQSPGGSAPKYAATYEFLLTKVKKLKADKTDGWEGNRIKFSTAKSSLGSDQRSFEAEIAWKPSLRETPTGKTVPSQDTVWCWHKATVELLAEIQAAGGPFGRAVDEYVGLTKKSGGRYGSSALGIKGEESLSAAEMGRVIESTPDLLKELEPRLGIASGRVFDPATELDVQLAQVRASIDDYIAAPYIVSEGESSELVEEEEEASDEK